MDVRSVKIYLIHWLTELQDKSVLKKLQGLKEQQESSFELSAEQKEELEGAGLRIMKMGKWSSPHGTL